jgi:DNA-directed RNA polymerase specialized sigma24 family protein
MIQPSDDQKHRRPRCDGPIAANDGGEELRESSAAKSQEASAYARQINERLGGFRFTEAEAADFRPQVTGEIERRPPEFLEAATVADLLQPILRRSRAFFLSKGVPFWDVEELESKLAVKVLEHLSKGNVPANASAWSKKVQATLFADYLRARYRAKKWFGDRQDADVLADVHDPSNEETRLNEEKAESLRVFIEGLPPQERDIVERLQAGDKWADIAKHYEMKVADIKKAVRSLEWPEGSLPLRKRRRRQ